MLRSILCVALILWSGVAMALPLPEAAWGDTCQMYLDVDPYTGYAIWTIQCHDSQGEADPDPEVEWTTDTECYDGYDAYDYP